MRSMLLRKGKIGVLVLLSVAGTSAAVLAPGQNARRSEKPVAAQKAAVGGRPPLKKEWIGRWQRDPFAGTIAIEIGLGNHRVTDPQKVAALMKKLTIRAFHNGMIQDFPMISRLTFIKKDDTRAYVWVGEGPFFSGLGGEMHITPDFLVALGRQVPNESGQPLDLLKRPSEKPAPSPLGKVWVPLTLEQLKKKLKTEFISFTISYHCGKRLHQARITDQTALEELAKALAATKRQKEKPPKVEDWPPQQFEFHCKEEGDAPTEIGCILDGEHLVLGGLGRVEVNPSFVKTLNAQLSRLEGRTVDVLGKNPASKEQLQREQALRDMLGTCRRLRVRHEDGKEILVQRREEVAQLLKSLAWVETPAHSWKLERSGGFIELTTAKDKTLRFTDLQTGLENEKVDVGPHGGVLVDVSGFGPMWLDESFRLTVLLDAERRGFKDAERRAQETYDLVCQDLPAFLEQVFNLVVYFREGKDGTFMCLSAEGSRPILEELRRAKIEKMSWTDKQWDEELRKLAKRGAGALGFQPGMGFSMSVEFRDEKELLIPRFGRIVLQEPIIDKLRKALESDPKKAKQLEFLPRESE